MPLLLALVLLAQLPESIGALPKFEDFPVQETFKSVPVPPIIRTVGQRRFRTMIRQGAKKGPNFAGHYTIADWGCGLACIAIVVIDAKTGAIYDGPFPSLVFGQDLKYDLADYIDDVRDALVYKLNSSLLIVRGCTGFKIEDCGAYFYEWTGSKFKLLRKVPAARIPR